MLDCTHLAVQIQNEQSNLVARMSKTYDDKINFLQQMADFAEGLFVARAIRKWDFPGADPHEPEVNFVLADTGNTISVTAQKRAEGYVYHVQTVEFYTENHDDHYPDFDVAYNAIYAMIIREGAEIAFREGQRA